MDKSQDITGETRPGAAVTPQEIPPPLRQLLGYGVPPPPATALDAL
jgi:hypothetical protein